MKIGLLSVLALLACLQLISAVTIEFHKLYACLGPALGCSNIRSGHCCISPLAGRSSVRFMNSDRCKTALVYDGNASGCSSLHQTKSSGNVCISKIGITQYTGAKWVTTCSSHRPLLAGVAEHERPDVSMEQNNTKCTDTVTANALFHPDPSSKGTWILGSENVLQLFDQLMSLPDSKKVAWLTARGASFRPETADKINHVEDQFRT